MGSDTHGVDRWGSSILDASLGLADFPVADREIGIGGLVSRKSEHCLIMLHNCYVSRKEKICIDGMT